MNSLIKTSIKRPVTVCVLVVVLMAVGVLATLNMPTNLLPDIKMPMLGISVVYPGASAQSVEDGVTSKIEKALQTVPGITELDATSYDNVCVAVLTFDYGTDIDAKIEVIEDAFDSVAFPEGCQTPDYIKIDMNGTATATISVYNAAGDPDALTADANALAAKLSGIEGVGSVNVLGTPEKQIRITALDGLEISALLVVQALTNENLNIPLGSVMQDGTTVSIRNATDAASLLDVMRLPVELSLGGELFGKLDQAKSLLSGLENASLGDVTSLLDMLILLKNNSHAFDDPAQSDEEVRDALLNWIKAMDSLHLFEAMGITLPQNIDELLSSDVVRLMRQENFFVRREGATADNTANADPDSIVGKLYLLKKAHVNADGAPVYANGKPVVTDENGKRIAEINGVRYYVNSFGRVVNADNVPVDDNGAPLTLSDDQIAANYYSYGDYVVFSDDETLDICNMFCLGESLGMTVTRDIVRFVRTCDFGGVQTSVSDESGAADSTQTVYPDSIVVPLAYLGHAEMYLNNIAYAEYNNLLAVTIEVYAVSDANTTAVVDAIKNVIADTKLTSAVVLLDDKAQFISDSIDNVLGSIVIGGVLAIIVIFLFVRKAGSSLVVSVTMPLSVLVALAGLWAMGINLNLVSLGGLAVGIGMLVDNSIVVLESITKRRDMGDSVYDACLNGTKEVAGSLLASTLTNVCVFFPILFARGLTREIFYDLVWAVLFSIVMSLIVAVTVIPSLYHLIYRKDRRKRYKKNPDGTYSKITAYQTEPRENINNRNEKSLQRRKAFKERVERLRAKLNKASFGKLEQGYGKALSKILTKRVLVCVVALALFGASVALVFTTGTEFMPSVDKGVIEVDLDFDPSTSLDEATACSSLVADAVRERYGDKLQYVSMTVGQQGLLATSNSGVIRIQTDANKPAKERLDTSKTVQEIRELIKTLDVTAKSVAVREMDGVVAEVTGGMAGQSVTLLGNDMETLRSAAATVTQRLLEADPQHIVSAVDNTPSLNTEVSFKFDRTLCAERGVDYQTAVMLLRVGLSGYTAANVTIDGESRQVNVLFSAAAKYDLDGLANIVVGFDSDGVVKLADVLQYNDDGLPYTTNSVASSINKRDGKYSTSIDLEIYGIDSGSVGKVISRTVNEALAGYDGVEYVESGVASYLNDAFDGLVVSLIAAFVLLYSVMACQFESLSKPFVVIMSIPFSFTGGFLALAITGMTLNVVSFVGLIMLMGVIVNGAIVMIDKINMLIAEGMTPQEAVIDGCKSRLRPILMTTLTTVLALVPLALGFGRGGELMQPMGIVVLGGLLLGTTVTLILIPCFYCLIKRIRFDKRAVASDESGEGQGENAPSAEQDSVAVGESDSANTVDSTDEAQDVSDENSTPSDENSPATGK